MFRVPPYGERDFGKALRGGQRQLEWICLSAPHSMARVYLVSFSTLDKPFLLTGHDKRAPLDRSSEGSACHVRAERDEFGVLLSKKTPSGSITILRVARTRRARRAFCAGECVPRGLDRDVWVLPILFCGGEKFETVASKK
jgi:hypothetical protein